MRTTTHTWITGLAIRVFTGAAAAVLALASFTATGGTAASWPPRPCEA